MAPATAKSTGAKYKEDRVPDPAFATEDHPAVVSLYRCPTVEAILDQPLFPAPLNPAKHISPLHMLPLQWFGFYLSNPLHLALILLIR